MQMDLATVMYTCVTSKIDDFNTPYIGMAAGTLKKIQLVVSQYVCYAYSMLDCYVLY